MTGKKRPGSSWKHETPLLESADVFTRICMWMVVNHIFKIDGIHA